MKILIISPIDPDAIDQLSRQHDVVCAFKAHEQQLRKLIEDREVLVFRSGVNVNAELMDCAPGLKLLVGLTLQQIAVEKVPIISYK